MYVCIAVISVSLGMYILDSYFNVQGYHTKCDMVFMFLAKDGFSVLLNCRYEG